MISESDHHVIAQLEAAFARPAAVRSERRGWTAVLLVVGLAAVVTGAELDHALGFLAAVVGVVVVALALAHTANLVSQHLSGGQGRRLTLRRWSGV